MTTATTVSARDISRTPGIRARTVNDAEVRASLDVLGSLPADAWSRPTSCTGWSVRDMAAHEVGQCEELAKPWLMFTRIRRARPRHPELGALDGHNESQIEERADLPPERLVHDLAKFGRRGVRGLARVPEPLRRRLRTSLVFPAEGRALPEDSMEYLNSVLVARDMWMHRIDISDATGAEPVLDEHDREIMHQILLDLALDWTGPPCLLELSGPIGGRYRIGDRDGPPAVTLRADAVAFARHLSGRPARGDLRFEGDEETASALADARVVF
ncbi:maleylpyruvate isomerase family mycothiol-dependent enzyme [Streptomyces chilikensis]|uniref:Maleylpyruvate isomerase family mycothiol-dependent enzyme n=1 Tax=Streptomyces chilikensis TaxID=1194079 RepID=A0ABV3EIA5_9ACTN